MNKSNEMKEKVIELRRSLHKCHETGDRLPRTREIVCRRLKELVFCGKA